MSAGAPSLMPSRTLLALAAAALVFGVRYDAYAYGNHREKDGGGVIVERAEGLPDLERGRQAAAAGRLDDAEADLRPLAERGYVEAQIALASLYAHLGTPERVAQAIEWLRVARTHSPLDTETPLGRLLVRQRDDASIDEGTALLADAWQRHHDPDALAGLIRVYSEYPQRDHDHQAASLVARAERIGTPAVQGAIIDWYRSTRADDGHAEKLVTLCARWVDQAPGCYVDLARAARAGGDIEYLTPLVAAAGKKYDAGLVDAQTLASMARVLVAPLAGDAERDDDDDGAAPAPAVAVSDVTEDPGELSQTAIQTQAAQQPSGACTRIALTPATAGGGTPNAADAGSPPAQPDLANTLLGKLLDGADDAAVLAAGIVTRYPYLLPNADIEARLKQGVEHGIAEASLYLGQLYLSGGRTARDPRLALQYLQQAAADPATALKGHYQLGRLYQYGYLDESRPLLAAQYLMWSARRGDAAADGALARLFFNGKGLCPDLVNAEVFARLGARDGSASIAQLERQIAAQLSAEQLASADALYAAERAARPSAYRIPPEMLAEAADIARRHGVAVVAAETDDAVAVDGAATAAASDAPPAADTMPVASAAEAGDAVDTDEAPSADTLPLAAAPPPAAIAAESAAATNAAAATPADAASSLAEVIVTPVDDDRARAAPAIDAAVAAPSRPLAHRASDDPAIRALLDAAPPAAARVAPPPSPTDAKSIEYLVPVQVPPAAPVPSRSGDPS
ncbi:MAG TPA: SEL1-like repeat protein [Solimonas sp.]|nr:SEL1-like repeat protein [Solimonas sp.]